MAIDTTNPDFYNLKWDNFANGPYLKNANMQCGRLVRNSANGFTDEILIRPDLTGIPLGSTINTVEVKYRTTDTSQLDTTSTNNFVNMYEQDRGAWSDTPTTSPVFNTFSTTTGWATSIGTGPTMSLNQPNSTITIPSTASTVQLWQDYLDSVKNNDGIVLWMNATFFSYVVVIDLIEIEVDYTPGS